MHCLQFDFPDIELMDPSNVFQIRTGFILSNKFDLVGVSVMLSFLDQRFRKLSLHRKANIVYQFSKSDPGAAEAFEGYFKFEKQKRSMKHLPKNLLILAIKMEKDMERIMNDWINDFDEGMKKVGYYGLTTLSESGKFEYYFFQDSDKSTPDCLHAIDILTNKEPARAVDNAIWHLSESFYHEDLFKNGCIKKIKDIKENEPFLIECLRIPDLNLLTLPEIRLLKEQLDIQIEDFRNEAADWAIQCYNEGSGITNFQSKLMPLIASVQKAIDNNPILNQWTNNVVKQPSTTIYFGEVSPEILWRYHKTHLTITEEVLTEMLTEYGKRESYSVPVMVFAYNTEKLKLQTESIIDIENRAAIFGVKKNMKVD